MGELRNYTPVDVVNYPVKSFEPVEDIVNMKLDTKFNFLTVAQTGPRKNVNNLVAGFVEEFHDDKDTGLVIKLFTRNNSVIDREETTINLQRILRNWPDKKCKVYLLHGAMTDAEINSLYNNKKIKGYVSLTHGEGFGLPLFEAAYNGLPVIVPPWSGQMDFLNPKQSTLIEGEVKPVPKGMIWKPIIVEPSKWFCADEGDIIRKLRFFKKNHRTLKHQAKILGQVNRGKHSLDAMKKEFNQILDNIVKQIPETPKPVSLKLPKLQKKTERKQNQISRSSRGNIFE